MPRPDRSAAAEDFGWRVAEALRRRRVRLGLSQEAVAERAGLTTNYLARIERRKVNASLDTLERIVIVLGREQGASVPKRWFDRTVRRVDESLRHLTELRKWLVATATNSERRSRGERPH